jgi:hypothetical protein
MGGKGVEKMKSLIKAIFQWGGKLKKDRNFFQMSSAISFEALVVR